MRKILTLCAAMLVAIAVNAGTTSVSSGVNTLKAAVATATAGDVLELGDGIYYEEGNFDMKINLTIKAAEGAKPVIANRYYFRVEGGADITFKGLKFDGAGWRNGEEAPIGASDHCVRSYSASTGEEDVVFENCEFTGYPSYILYTQRSNRSWNSITIRNCYFYNNKKSAVYITNESGDTQSCDALTIENTTFANFADAYDVIYYNAPDAEHTTTLNVNHCTFYNHPKRAIYWQKSENLSVSNSIFVQPATNTYKSVECVAGTVSNCLSYNSAGYSSATTRTGNIVEDPKFKDAANSDFTLDATSPAIAAGTDGKSLGDPRWWPAPAVTKYAITIEASEHGVITADKTEAEAGETVTLTITPDADYTLSGFGISPNVDASDITIEGNKRTFPMPANDVTVSSIFAKIQYKINFYKESAEEGEGPASVFVEKGSSITLPVNRTLYKEGYTMTGWKVSGESTVYAIGDSFTPTAQTDFIPVYAANTADLLTSTTELTVKWAFEEGVDGTPSMHLEGNKGILVTQATVAGVPMDVKMEIDATAGKFYNKGRGANWCQVNAGTKFSFPSKAGATVAIKAYSEPSDNTILDGSSKTAWASNVATYAAAPTANVSQFETKDNNQYFAYLQVTLPANVKYYVKNNWARGEWEWKEMTQDGTVYKLDGVQFGSTGFNYNTKADAEGQAWLPVGDANLIGTFDEMDIINLVLNPAAGTLTATLVTEYIPTLANGYYLMGSFNEWKPAAAYAMAKVEGAATEEYKVNATFALNDELKVAYVYRDGAKTWYLDENYKIENAAYVGEKTIYFRPNKDGEMDWLAGGYIYIADIATGIDNTVIDANAVKAIENGQLIIIKNGVKYNAIGVMVK